MFSDTIGGWSKNQHKVSNRSSELQIFLIFIETIVKCPLILFLDVFFPPRGAAVRPQRKRPSFSSGSSGEALYRESLKDLMDPNMEA